MGFALIGFGLFVFVVGGAALAVYNWTRLRRLERSSSELAARLSRLEAGTGERPADTVSPLRPAQPVPEPAPVPETETTLAAGSPPAPEPSVVPRPAAEPRPDLETLVAGRWLNRVAIVALLMAAAFFLKYAFDNDWIGPAGRVAIGLLAGSGLMVASQWLLARGYRYFSEGIAGLGGGVLFLSLYAAWSFYSLIPQWAAFTGMVVVTGALAGLALGRESERLAVVALLAGLAVPGLLSGNADPLIERFSYLAILIGCFLALGWRRTWRWIAPVALFGFLAYFVDWADTFYADEKLAATATFASVLFLEFAVFLVARGRSAVPLSLGERLLILLNAGWYGLSLHLLLYDDHRWWLTIAVLLTGALHLAAALLLRREGETERLRTRLLFAGLALTCATAAIAIRLEGEWITIAWALEGALLIWAGFRSESYELRAAGLALFTAVIGLLLFQAGEIDRLLLNKRFASFAAAVGSLAASYVWARARRDELRADERGAFRVVGIAISVVSVWALSEETWSFLGRQQWDLDPELAQQMGLSLLWVIAAAVLVFLGARRESAPLRWQGLALMGLAIGKIFLVDLSFLERAYRIASFLVLGIVLLGVSFWYQRNLVARDEETQPDD
jgi:uncharacterized membrane protein